MRLSVRPGDPGYAPAERLARARVLLNGQELDLCVTADEERGEAVVMVRAARNGVLVGQDGSPLEVTLRGQVRVVLP